MNFKPNNRLNIVIAAFCLVGLVNPAVATANSDRNLIRKAYNVADDINRYAGEMSPQEKIQIQGLLQQIETVLLYGGGGQQQVQISCVSRDNDGRNPWMLAIRETSISYARLNGTTVNDQATCENMRSSIVSKEGMNLVCLTRDNDGQNPWMLANIDIERKELNLFGKNLVFKTQRECLLAIDDSMSTREGLLVCASTDRDGRNPYSQYIVGRGDRVVKGDESFSSVSSCTEANR